MNLIETEPGQRVQASKRSRGTASPARRDEGTLASPAASGSLAGRLRAIRNSVWAPVLVKGAAVLAGMLALAAIGASSLARGSGVPLPTPSSAPASKTHGTVAALGALTTNATPDGGHALQAAPSASGEPPAPKANPGLTADGRVILNAAGPAELRHLPGIGAKRAEAIVALRAKLGGRFKRVTDLLRVKGIGPKGLKKLEPHVVLDAPKPS